MRSFRLDEFWAWRRKWHFTQRTSHLAISAAITTHRAPLLSRFDTLLVFTPLT